MSYHTRPLFISQIIVPLVRDAAAVQRLKRSLLMAARIRLVVFHLRQLLLELGRQLPEHAPEGAR